MNTWWHVPCNGPKLISLSENEKLPQLVLLQSWCCGRASWCCRSGTHLSEKKAMAGTYVAKREREGKPYIQRKREIGSSHPHQHVPCRLNKEPNVPPCAECLVALHR